MQIAVIRAPTFTEKRKIIENPGKINFLGKSWKNHGKFIKI